MIHDVLIFLTGAVAGCIGGMLLMALMVVSGEDERKREEENR